jgi:hypothetical protein
LWLGLSLSCANGFASAPQLLLTPRRLHRLQLDRQRQTVRWMNFENRVKTVPDSPERGFELALYYAVTHDEERGKQAVRWSAGHPCELRQDALVRDWVAAPAGDSPCFKHAAAARDLLFQAIASDGDAASVYSTYWKPMLASLEQGGFRDPQQLYTAIEFIDAARGNLHSDPREDDPAFFSALPVELLLSLKPQQIEHPDWKTHAAALALVTLDPNLPASQYLQGWAMENRQTIQEGPGVAYEFLWADPYLPGIGYQNLEPWIYDPHGRLFARAGWNADACWIGISEKGVEEQNCPAGWREKPASFGRMTLIPATQPCVELPAPGQGESFVLWNLQPGQTISYLFNGKRVNEQADSAGLWRVPGAARGKVCRTR